MNGRIRTASAAVLLAVAVGARAEAPAAGGQYLTFFVEPYQAAFYMLIPRGWKAEGGMVGSGVDWNPVDMLDGNIRFRVTSPDGGSFFGFYPRFLFADPARYAQASGGLLQVPAGHVMNGHWMYPLMTIPQYAQTIVFGKFAAGEFVQPRLLGDAVPVPELCKLAPPPAVQPQGGYVDFACTIRGAASRGRLYTVIHQLPGGGTWTTAFTAGLVAPKDRWGADERLMEYCLRTFKLNPEYVKAATEGAIRRGREMVDLQRQINEERLRDQREHLLHSTDSQQEFYKVLTGQIETRDPETGAEKWLPAYNRAYTDGKGNYFLSDSQGTLPVENNPEWRALKIINRNAPRGSGP